METQEQKKRRLFGKVNYIPKYLEELSRLLQRDVKADELLSIIETDEFIHGISYFQNKEPFYRTTIKFSDKATLKSILQKEISDFDVPYYMYLSYSLECGLMRLSSLREFNLDFSFYDEHSGFIIFTRVDGEERILLDSFEENGEAYLEIQIYKKDMLRI